MPEPIRQCKHAEQHGEQPTHPPGSVREVEIRAFRRRLLTWYDRGKRDLPWRRRTDSYAIWVSEIMLQQTRVEVVSARFSEFLRAFPDIKSLARASEEEVLSHWSGLGYYSRARLLRRGAGLVTEEFGGLFPREFAPARRIPGVGPYTAAAVLSIAYGLPHAVVDGNVARVLARLHLLEPPEDRRASTLTSLAQRLLSIERPGDHNQAMMELGAVVCLPVSPHCPVCPVRRFCRASIENLTALYPEPRRRTSQVDLEYRLLLIRDRRGKLVLEKGRWRLLPHLWLPPILEVEDDASRWARPKSLRPVGNFPHSITHHRLRFEVLTGEFSGLRGHLSADLLLADEDRLREIGRSSVLTKALKLEAMTLWRTDADDHRA